MYADVAVGRPIIFRELVGVSTIAIYGPHRCREPSIPKEKHECMNTFLIIDVKVPEHVRIRRVCAWMSLVASIHGRKFDGVSNKEDRLKGSQ